MRGFTMKKILFSLALLINFFFYLPLLAADKQSLNLSTYPSSEKFNLDVESPKGLLDLPDELLIPIVFSNQLLNLNDFRTIGSLELVCSRLRAISNDQRSLKNKYEEIKKKYNEEIAITKIAMIGSSGAVEFLKEVFKNSNLKKIAGESLLNILLQQRLPQGILTLARAGISLDQLPRVEWKSPLASESNKMCEALKTSFNLALFNKNYQAASIIAKYGADIRTNFPMARRSPWLDAILTLDISLAKAVINQLNPSELAVSREALLEIFPKSPEVIKKLIYIIEQKLSKVCVLCTAKAQKKCSQCKQVYYCTQNCQQKDWKSHKLLCNSINNTVNSF